MATFCGGFKNLNYGIWFLIFWEPKYNLRLHWILKSSIYSAIFLMAQVVLMHYFCVCNLLILRLVISWKFVDTLSHALTMTDCCGMLSKIYTGERRDLAASVLFQVPFLREVKWAITSSNTNLWTFCQLLLALGCVDASSFTANYNLKKGRSLLIFIGGEKEQLLTKYGEQKIFVKHKGFIKLALQYGVDLVPMVKKISYRIHYI